MSHYEDGLEHGRASGSSALSGEWAGESIGELIDGYAEMSDDERDEACDAYEHGFSEGFWAEVERSATIAAGVI